MADLTIYIAIYGAILSTVAIFWNIIKDIKDKPSVKISASMGLITFHGNQEPETVYTFSAVNKNKRPVTLTSAGIRTEKDQDMLFVENTNLPKKLNEGDTVSFYRSVNTFYPQIRGHQAQFLWFRDTTGKLYKNNTIGKLFLKDYRTSSSQ